MELTKEQIEMIDNRLKKNGIKYWDLRMEMLDHVVTEVEKNMEKEGALEEVITNSFIALGWNGNLKHLNQKGWQNTNDKYRRDYHKGFIGFFKKSRHLFILLIFVSVLYATSQHLSFKLFKKVIFILVIIPVIPFFFLAVKQLFKKYGKSVNLDYGTFYFSFALLMINLPLQLIKYTSEANQKILLTLCISIYFIATYSGYKIYNKAITKVENMRKQLLS
jgi:hypothetical protein